MQTLKSIIIELKNTTWPTPSELVTLTVYTLIVCGIIASLILGLDLFLTRLRDIIL